MKSLHIFLLLFFLYGYCLAQKRLVTSKTYESWEEISNGGLSSDGKFAYYTIKNNPFGKKDLVLKGIAGDWQKRILNCTNPFFSYDSRFFFSIINGDSLLQINLKSHSVNIIEQISRPRIMKRGKEEFIVYINKSKCRLILRSLDSNNELSFKDVSDYSISQNGEALIMLGCQLGQNNNKRNIYWGNLRNGIQKRIYQGEGVVNLIIDGKGVQGAFIDDRRGIFYYNQSLDSAKSIVNNSNIKKSLGLNIDALDFNFNNDADILFFTLKKNKFKEIQNDSIQPRIWNYQDKYLQSSYHNNYGLPQYSYLSKVDLHTFEVTQILRGNEKIAINTFHKSSDEFLVIESCDSDPEDVTIKDPQIDYYICNTKNGSKEAIELGKKIRLSNFKMSPKRNYIAYYDPEKSSYNIYDIKNKRHQSISSGVEENLYQYLFEEYPIPTGYPSGIIGWYKNEDAILIKSEFNIWRLDPLGIKAPVNLTKTSNISSEVFNLASDTDIDLNWGSDLLVTGFNIKSKNLSFYKLKLDDKPKLSFLSSGPYYFSFLENAYFTISSNELIKAKGANVYLILKQQSDKSPNFYLTKDFVTFNQISNINPEKNYNWLKTELHSYKDSLGINLQAIVYKPENFDRSKPYPILISYYADKSNFLNKFQSVDPIMADFSIPIAVSNGYIVCLADIKVEIGHPGEGGLNSIMALVNNLSNYSWADTSKMAIIGHSFGGFLTNYIITHTTKFKAAISGAGISDFISMGCEIWGEGQSKQFYYQYGLPRMGASVTSNPLVYIENSPLLFSNKVKTPLLLLHNDLDNSVPVRQSRQFFIALRSLGKEVWWLNYKNEGHTLLMYQNQLDYNKKVFDFLDCKLKGEAAAKWMKEHL